MDLEDAEYDELFASFDENGNGQIELNEFVAMVAKGEGSDNANHKVFAQKIASAACVVM
jgi:hypothetical protein